MDVLAGRTALVLGAGGVAKAVCYALNSRNVKLVIANRKPERAIELAKRWGARAVPFEDRKNVQCDMLVNCTDVGRHPDVNKTPYEGEWMNRSMIVFDAVYTPEQTLFIKEARNKGCAVVTGLDMFVRQAARQFQLFTDVESTPELMDMMRDVVRRSIGAAKQS